MQTLRAQRHHAHAHQQRQQERGRYRDAQESAAALHVVPAEKRSRAC